jgi:acyl-CoA synthetase (AMP-forming)/AMP-acid ligase II
MSTKATAANGSHSGPPPEATFLAELVSSAARRDPLGIALVSGRSKLTFAELDRAVTSMTLELLDRGVEPGDAIAVLAGTGLEFPILAHAVLRAGAVLVPISPSSPPAEASRLLHAARVEMLLADREHEAAAWQAATTYDPDCGAIALDANARRSKGDQLGLDSLLTGAASPRRRPG